MRSAVAEKIDKRITVTTVCAICSEPGSSKCSKCKLSRYCGVACQLTSWKAEHGKSCNAYTRFLDSNSVELRRVGVNTGLTITTTTTISRKWQLIARKDGAPLREKRSRHAAALDIVARLAISSCNATAGWAHNLIHLDRNLLRSPAAVANLAFACGADQTLLNALVDDTTTLVESKDEATLKTSSSLVFPSAREAALAKMKCPPATIVGVALIFESLADLTLCATKVGADAICGRILRSTLETVLKSRASSDSNSNNTPEKREASLESKEEKQRDISTTSSEKLRQLATTALWRLVPITAEQLAASWGLEHDSDLSLYEGAEVAPEDDGGEVHLSDIGLSRWAREAPHAPQVLARQLLSRERAIQLPPPNAFICIGVRPPHLSLSIHHTSGGGSSGGNITIDLARIAFVCGPLARVSDMEPRICKA